MCDICCNDFDELLYCSCGKKFCFTCTINFISINKKLNCMFHVNGCKKIFTFSEIENVFENINQIKVDYFNFIHSNKINKMKMYNSHLNSIKLRINNLNIILKRLLNLQEIHRKKIKLIIRSFSSNYSVVQLSDLYFVNNLVDRIVEELNLPICEESYLISKNLHNLQLKCFYFCKVDNILNDKINMISDRLKRLECIFKLFNITSIKSLKNIPDYSTDKFAFTNKTNLKWYFQNDTLIKKTIKCPNDNCTNYIPLTKKMKCLCGVKVCFKCRETFFDDHECDKNTLKHIKMIKKDLTECPTCGMSIERIDGCDQMFCIQCNTKFDFKTKEKLKLIHNPHFEEYIQRIFSNLKLINSINIRSHYLFNDKMIINISMFDLIRSIENKKIKNFEFLNITGTVDCLTFQMINKIISINNWIDQVDKIINKNDKIKNIYDTILIPFKNDWIKLVENLVLKKDKEKDFMDKFIQLIKFYNSQTKLIEIKISENDFMFIYDVKIYQ